MSKRILSLVLTLALVLGSFSMAFAAPADVVGKPVEDAVERLGNLGILTGYEDGSFKPENNITRAEFAAVVSRATGLEQAAINSKGKTVFGDVPASHWASGYVNVSDKAGLVKGMGKVNGVNTFAPEANITYEQAVTLVVRALGYEPAAQANGGYPTGHLVVASQEGLLEGVNGSVGQLASRALVAQLTDNALEVPKMVQVGFGDQKKFVKSGTENTKEQFLFNDLQLKDIEGQLSADSKKNKITVANKSLIVTDKNFDYAGLDGLKVQVWYNKDDKVVSVKKLSEYTVKFDAVKINKTKEELTTVTEDKDYDFAKSVTVKGEVSRYSDLASEYSFAKIVLDEYGDVTWMEVYKLDETVVVSEIKGNDVKGYDGNDIADANKYSIIKDGKQVPFTSLKEKDVVLYDSGEEYAAVVTNIKEGKLDTVYENSFKFEGKNYDNAGVQYISGTDLQDVTKDVLSEMKDNGEVKAFFNFNNKPVLVNGKVEEVVSNYVMLTSDSTLFQNRGKDYVTFDYKNAEGTKVKNEIELESNGNVDEDIVDKVKESTISSKTNFIAAATKGKVFKVSLDAKGSLSQIETVYVSKNLTKDFKLDAAYAEGYKLQNTTTVFYNDGTVGDSGKYGDYKVTTLDKAKEIFSEVKVGTTTDTSKIIVDKNGKIVTIVAVRTDVEDDTTWATGIVKDVRTTTNDRYVTLEIDGVEKEYKGKKDDVNSTLAVEKGIVDLKVTKDGIIKDVKATLLDTVILTKSATGTEVEGTINGSSVKLVVEGKYYEKQSNGEYKKVNTSDFKAGEVVTVYYREGSKKFVQLVVKGATVGTDTQDELQLVLKKGNDTVLVINGKEYKYVGLQTLDQLVALQGEVVKITLYGNDIASVEKKTVTPDPVVEAKKAFNTDYDAANASSVTEGKTADSVVAYKNAINAAKAKADAATTVEAVNTAKDELVAAKSLLIPVTASEITAQKLVVENPLIKKFLVLVRLSDETQNSKVTGFIVNGAPYSVKQITTDGRVQADVILDSTPSTVQVIVNGKTIEAK